MATLLKGFHGSPSPALCLAACHSSRIARFVAFPWAFPLHAPHSHGFRVLNSRRFGIAKCGGNRAIGVRAEGNGGESSPGERFTVTTPLYYVNAAPHMGSAYPTIAADALARFHRLQGRDVNFITGTDEHGEKIALAAAAKGRAPKEHCDAVAAEYQLLWKELGIAYDKFIRTTDDHHEVLVAEFYKRVEEKGDIYQAKYEGLYCVNCEEYKDEDELIEDQCCPIHRKPCEARKEDNYFFALSKYQQPLEELLSSNPDFVRPSFRMNEVKGWVKEGLRDFSISRAAVEWGIPVPTDPKQTIYVWFDALLGYISALLAEGKEPNLTNATERGWPASVHIIGKDILRFHAIYWPAMLMSAGLPLPEAVFGHGFLTKDGLKMGKSLGNTIEPRDLVSRFGPDAVRYYFLKEIEFGKDGDFSEGRFIDIINAHLANTIGNLLNRTLGLLKKNCNATIAADATFIPENNPMRVLAIESVNKAAFYYSELDYSSACDIILGIASAGNLYMNEKAPWSLFKQGGSAAEDAAQHLTVILEAVRIMAVALSPVVPELCSRIYSQLGYAEADFKSISWTMDPGRGVTEKNVLRVESGVSRNSRGAVFPVIPSQRSILKDSQWGGLKGGQVMADAQPIFQRLEDPNAPELENSPAKTGGKKKKVNVKQKADPAVANASAS